eukprot:scaffold28968_cov17-Tisochrysis_lutea.AAC.4
MKDQENCQPHKAHARTLDDDDVDDDGDLWHLWHIELASSKDDDDVMVPFGISAPFLALCMQVDLCKGHSNCACLPLEDEDMVFFGTYKICGTSALCDQKLCVLALRDDLDLWGGHASKSAPCDPPSFPSSPLLKRTHTHLWPVVFGIWVGQLHQVDHLRERSLPVCGATKNWQAHPYCKKGGLVQTKRIDNNGNRALMSGSWEWLAAVKTYTAFRVP